MSRTNRVFYGWFDQREETFHLSKVPPDATVRPSMEFQTKAEVLELAKRYRAEVLWWPPLNPSL